MSTIIGRSIDAATITPITVLAAWESEDEPQTIVHPILGSENVAVTLRPAAPRTGTIRLLFWDAATAEAARVFHRAAAVFTADSDLIWVPSGYVVNGAIRPAQQQHPDRWVLAVPYQELQL